MNRKMKVVLSIIILMFFYNAYSASIWPDDTASGLNTIHSQGEPSNEKERSERFEINFGVSYPFHVYTGEFLMNPEMEILFYTGVIENVEVSAGLGFQFGEHVWIEDYGYVNNVNGRPWLTKGTNRWHLMFYSLYMPVYYAIPVNNFIETIIPGFCLGRNFGNNLYEKKMPEVDEKLNKTYLDLNLGIKKNLYKNKVHIIPSFGRTIYLTDKNSWQKNYYFSELKLQVRLN